MLPGGLSADGYLDRRLRPLDAEHYSAAGLLPYRRSAEALELLLPRERPWNSFTQAYDPISLNVFCSKRVPRQERCAEVTAARSFAEAMGQTNGLPDQDAVQSLMQNGFVVWYPMGKFALAFIEVPSESWGGLPESFGEMKKSSGTQELITLPQGIKKWSKQIDDLQWVAARSIVEQGAEVSDLLGSMLPIVGFRSFLLGEYDPAKTLDEGAPIKFATVGGKAEGKGKNKEWGKGKGTKGCKGYNMVPMMVPAMAKGIPMMCAGGKGMPVMPQLFCGSPDQNVNEMQRQMYGEQLYILVQPMAPSPYLAQKITGMLLELPHNELLLNLTNQEELQRRVCEAMDVLREDGVV